MDFRVEKSKKFEKKNFQLDHKNRFLAKKCRVAKKLEQNQI